MNKCLKKETFKKILFFIITGIVVGFANGFFGGGGGMLVVPILIYFFNLPQKNAHATALLIILPLCVCSSVVYFLKDNVDIIISLKTGCGFILGGIVGALLLNKLDSKVISIIFSLVMISAGIVMLLK